MQTSMSYIKASLAVNYNLSSSCSACNACELRRVRQSWFIDSHSDSLPARRGLLQRLWCSGESAARCGDSDSSQTISAVPQTSQTQLSALVLVDIYSQRPSIQDHAHAHAEPRPIPTPYSVQDLERDLLLSWFSWVGLMQTYISAGERTTAHSCVVHVKCGNKKQVVRVKGTLSFV